MSESTRAELDRERDRIVEGLHEALGDHGATLDELGAVVEALSAALWSAEHAAHARESGEKLERKGRGQLRRHGVLEQTGQALIALSGLHRTALAGGEEGE